MTDIVEAQWQRLLTTAGEPELPAGTPPLEPFLTLVRAAYAEPLLRQLYPWTSHWRLGFSRCTAFPFTMDIPLVYGCSVGGYRVEQPKSGPYDTEWIGDTSTAQEAVAMVVERLPPGCGPAFIGTTEDLAAYERTQDTR
ncbi:DUF6193 family natural product biosynthesis protein [Streptomyces spongiicola]|uniref:DUF6193 family natural product biosynthesis protein n=1 Tax=Streptomyces spongiicola TaxID=1690221 RepID=UPI001CB742AE|nr:DUF6193 family natural product biosynthesis protein [Streptomyces spongiicola]